MAVFVLAPLMSEDLERTVRNHFVRIHIGRGAGSALHHVHDEMLVEFALTHLFARFDDRLCHMAVDQSQITVRTGSGLLDHRQSLDQLREKVKPHAADVEVLQSAHRLYAEIILYRHLFVAQQVMFRTGLTRKLTFRNIHNFRRV